LKALGSVRIKFVLTEQLENLSPTQQALGEKWKKVWGFNAGSFSAPVLSCGFFYGESSGVELGRVVVFLDVVRRAHAQWKQFPIHSGLWCESKINRLSFVCHNTGDI